MSHNQIPAELLFEHTSDGIAVLDEQFHFVRLNDKGILLFRRPIAQLIGMSVLDFFKDTGDVENPARSKLTEAMNRRVPSKFEAFLPGLFSWHSVLAVPNGGELILFLRDITERIRREQDSAVKAIVRNIIEDLPIAIAITRGREHRLELVNGAIRRLWPKRALEGERVERVFPEARGQGFLDLLDSVYASGKRIDGVERSMAWDPDGSGALRQAFFNVIYQPLFAVSGEVNGIVHIGIDVTSQVTERKLVARQASERAAVLDQLSEGVIVTDAVGKITFVNEAALRLHGVAVLGIEPDGYTNAYSLLTEAGEPHPIEDLPLTQTVVSNLPTTDVRWKIRRPDGSEVLVTGSAKPVFHEHGERIACVLTMHEVRTGAA